MDIKKFSKKEWYYASCHVNTKKELTYFVKPVKVKIINYNDNGTNYNLTIDSEEYSFSGVNGTQTLWKDVLAENKEEFIEISKTGFVGFSNSKNKLSEELLKWLENTYKEFINKAKKEVEKLSERLVESQANLENAISQLK